RAAFEIGVLRQPVVELLDQLFGLERHLVNRAVREVHNLLRMAQAKHPVGTIGGRVTGIGSGGRIAQPQGHLHVGITLNRSGKSSVSDGEEPSVPVLGRHPELDVDVGVGGWLEDHCDAAMLRERRWAWRRRAAATPTRISRSSTSPVTLSGACA